MCSQAQTKAFSSGTPSYGELDPRQTTEDTELKN